MMRLAPILLAGLLLAGCNDSNSPSPLPPSPVFNGSISVMQPWAITESSNKRPLVNGGFDFLSAASARTAHDSYVQLSFTFPLNTAQTYTIRYTITGDNPTWVYDSSADNTCVSPAHITLILQRAGDNLSGVGAFEYYRWFSRMDLVQPLELGSHTISVPLEPAKWISVYGHTGDTTGDNFAQALLYMGSIGFGFGGGCFAAHGVAVSTGSARFQLDAVTVQ